MKKREAPGSSSSTGKKKTRRGEKGKLKKRTAGHEGNEEGVSCSKEGEEKADKNLTNAKQRTVASLKRKGA